MIICNLAVLLAERHLKITKVSLDTKISRTTLTALVNNYGSGIQFDTINTLCQYLKINPEQLILFAPVDIEQIEARITNKCSESSDIEISMFVKTTEKATPCSMPGYINIARNVEGIYHVDINIEMWDEEANQDDKTLKEENQIIEKAFKLLSRPFIEHISDKVQHEILQTVEAERFYIDEDGDAAVDRYTLVDGYSVNFHWPFDDWRRV